MSERERESCPGERKQERGEAKQRRRGARQKAELRISAETGAPYRQEQEGGRKKGETRKTRTNVHLLRGKLPHCRGVYYYYEIL